MTGHTQWHSGTVAQVQPVSSSSIVEFRSAHILVASGVGVGRDHIGTDVARVGATQETADLLLDLHLAVLRLNALAVELVMLREVVTRKVEEQDHVRRRATLVDEHSVRDPVPFCPFRSL